MSASHLKGLHEPWMTIGGRRQFLDMFACAVANSRRVDRLLRERFDALDPLHCEFRHVLTLNRPRPPDRSTLH